MTDPYFFSGEAYPCQLKVWYNLHGPDIKKNDNFELKFDLTWYYNGNTIKFSIYTDCSRGLGQNVVIVGHNNGQLINAKNMSDHLLRTELISAENRYGYGKAPEVSFINKLWNHLMYSEDAINLEAREVFFVIDNVELIHTKSK